MAVKYFVSDEQRANAATLNPILQGLNQRLLDLEKAGSALKRAQEEIINLGLERINEVVTPALEAIENVADLSDLFRAQSDTSAAIGTGVTEFIILPEDRVQFAPPLFVSISVNGETDKWMVGQVTSWLEATGQLFVNITHTKGAGTFDDWVVSPANTPNSGPTLDAYTKAEADAAIVAAVDQAKSDLLGGAPAAALDTIAELAAALGNDDDFATWVITQLTGKADTAHGHAIGDVTGLQAVLDGKADDADLTAKTDSATLAGTGGAALVGYDNTTSGLTADDLQDAVDELAGNSGGEWTEHPDGLIDLAGQSDHTFGAIPSGVTEIELNFYDIYRTNASYLLNLHIGDSGGLEASGYYQTQHQDNTSADASRNVSAWNVGYPQGDPGAVFQARLFMVTTNKWLIRAEYGNCDAASSVVAFYHINGVKTLSAELTQLRLQTSGGTFVDGLGTLRYR